MCLGVAVITAHNSLSKKEIAKQTCHQQVLAEKLLKKIYKWQNDKESTSEVNS